jgi:hypothetical protein
MGFGGGIPGARHFSDLLPTPHTRSQTAALNHVARG